MKYSIELKEDGGYRLVLETENATDATVLHDNVACAIAASGSFIRNVYLAGKGHSMDAARGKVNLKIAREV